MNNIDNPLSDYQSPPKEAMINFGIDISKEAVEKYALKKFGRLPQNHIEMNFAMGSKITEETRRFMRNEEIKK
nr:MAG TPA: RNA polymerase sigma factor [Bacteriophage sp.]